MTDLSPPIDYFKKAAKALHKHVREAESTACRRARAVFTDYRDKPDTAIASKFTLMRAQHVVAVEHEFVKWQDLAHAPATDLRLAITMVKIPELNACGVGLYPHHARLPVPERDKLLADERTELRRCGDRVAATVEWLQKHIRPIRTINLNHTSYGLKHIAEREIGYIPNGVFVAAAIVAGYRYRRIDEPNVAFGMSEHSIKESAKRVGYASEPNRTHKQGSVGDSSRPKGEIVAVDESRIGGQHMEKHVVTPAREWRV
jgi:hypothetical protein